MYLGYFFKIYFFGTDFADFTDWFVLVKLSVLYPLFHGKITVNVFSVQDTDERGQIVHYLYSYAVVPQIGFDNNHFDLEAFCCF